MASGSSTSPSTQHIPWALVSVLRITCLWSSKPTASSTLGPVPRAYCSFSHFHVLVMARFFRLFSNWNHLNPHSHLLQKNCTSEQKANERNVCLLQRETDPARWLHKSSQAFSTLSAASGVADLGTQKLSPEDNDQFLIWMYFPLPCKGVCVPIRVL